MLYKIHGCIGGFDKCDIFYDFNFLELVYKQYMNLNY